MESFRKIVVLALLLIGVDCAVFHGYGQAVPGTDENIPYLVTFGKDGETSWGDPYFYQIFFFAIPKDYTGQFYIRIFDADCGGEHDELKFDWNTRTLFSVYGGQGVDPNLNEESKGLNKGDNYKKGNLLAILFRLPLRLSNNLQPVETASSGKQDRPCLQHRCQLPVCQRQPERAVLCSCITLIVFLRCAQTEQYASLIVRSILQATGGKQSRSIPPGFVCGCISGYKGGENRFIDFIGDLFSEIAVVKKG